MTATRTKSAPKTKPATTRTASAAPASTAARPTSNANASAAAPLPKDAILHNPESLRRYPINKQAEWFLSTDLQQVQGSRRKYTILSQHRTAEGLLALKVKGQGQHGQARGVLANLLIPTRPRQITSKT